MKILIVNQQTANRGDEAAGKALIRNLLKLADIKKITVLYTTYSKHVDANFFNDKGSIVDNKDVFFYNFGKVRSLKFNLNFELYKIFLLPTIIRKILWRLLSGIIDRGCYVDMIRILSYDVIISAPTGPNIGNIYNDWAYLWRIYSAVKLKKKVIIYSPSIGSLSGNTLFEKKALQCIKSVNFLSTRDAISYSNLDELKIYNYKKSIDTAFLDSTVLPELPKELNFLKEKPYIVFVPNELYKWHRTFKHYDSSFKKILDDLYISILNSFSDIRIIMLPQLYAAGNDAKYFSSLCNKCSNNVDIHIINEMYNSDIQQTIIKESEFVIGARYHSIVFAIKNKVPMFSLSYEHKMSGLLMLLNLNNNEAKIDTSITNTIEREIVIQNIRNCFETRKNQLNKIINAKKTACEIANNTFIEAKKIISKQ